MKTNQTTETTRHTPGPWKKILGSPHVITDSGGRVVAKTIDSKFAYPEKEANARLITAAPQMLESLVELYRTCSDLPASDGRVIGLLPLLERAEAAIALAVYGPMDPAVVAKAKERLSRAYAIAKATR